MSPSASRQIELKSEKDLERMRRAGRVAGNVLRELGRNVRAGASTKDLDVLAEKLIRDAGAVPTFLGYQVGSRQYQASICVSINQEVVHGVPRADRILKNGDVVSIDVGATLDGFVGDTAATFPVGPIPREHENLIAATSASLRRGIEQARPGNRLGDISHAIQSFAESKGLGVVRDFVGHGIGRRMHEEPAVPNYGTPGSGLRLEEGLVLALEPMLTCGDWKVRVLGDGWTVVTQDGSFAAHFEHTVAITRNGPEILTVADGER